MPSDNVGPHGQSFDTTQDPSTKGSPAQSREARGPRRRVSSPRTTGRNVDRQPEGCFPDAPGPPCARAGAGTAARPIR